MRHIGPPYNKHKTIKLFNKVIATNGIDFFYVIRNIHTDQKVGMIGLMKRTEVSCFELGVMILIKYSNRGYAFKATKLLLEIAFNEVKALKVQTRCNVNNSGANRISKALGFVNQGIVFDESLNQFNCWEMTLGQFKLAVNELKLK